VSDVQIVSRPFSTGYCESQITWNNPHRFILLASWHLIRIRCQASAGTTQEGEEAGLGEVGAEDKEEVEADSTVAKVVVEVAGGVVEEAEEGEGEAPMEAEEVEEEEEEEQEQEEAVVTMKCIKYVRSSLEPVTVEMELTVSSFTGLCR